MRRLLLANKGRAAAIGRRSSMASVTVDRQFSSSSSSTSASSTNYKWYGGATAVAAAAGLLYYNQQNEKAGQQLAVAHKPRQETKLPQEFLESVRKIVGEDNVDTDLENRQYHGKPWNSYHRIQNFPDVVISPSSTQEVSEVMKLCYKYNIPVVPYGGATSFEGHILAPTGGVSLDMCNLKKILRVSEEDLDATVQPGIGYIDLNIELEKLGYTNLFFPLDPGPGATIGGMCSTRCSGSTAVRYGTMRDNVLNITAVLPNGKIIKTGTRAPKSSAGYDLTRLLIGAEGTLGVITEVTIKLRQKPEYIAALRVCFPSVADAAAACHSTRQAGVEVGRCEMMDDTCVDLVNKANDTKEVVATTLLYELIGTRASVEEQVKRVKEVAKKHKGYAIKVSNDRAQVKEMWRARKEALWAAMSVHPGTEALITDVCVPLSRLPELIQSTKDDIDSSFLPAPLVAHTGDGNFHAFIMINPEDQKQVAEAKRLMYLMVERAQSMGGTCTGEHGIGVGKIQMLEDELGKGTVQVMTDIKRTIDPQNIMNPGKVFHSVKDPKTGRLHVCS